LHLITSVGAFVLIAWFAILRTLLRALQELASREWTDLGIDSDLVPISIFWDQF